MGLKGVEVLSDRVREDQSIHAILDYPKKNYPRLVITIGSDCHGGSLDGAVNYTPRCQMGLKNSHGYDLSEFYNGIYDLLF